MPYPKLYLGELSTSSPTSMSEHEQAMKIRGYRMFWIGHLHDPKTASRSSRIDQIRTPDWRNLIEPDTTKRPSGEKSTHEQFTFLFSLPNLHKVIRNREERGIAGTGYWVEGATLPLFVQSGALWQDIFHLPTRRLCIWVSIELSLRPNIFQTG